MKVKFFPDTDTALIEFSARNVVETREISENIYVDLDASGNPVAMTIEHAAQHADLPHLSYEQIGVPAHREKACNLAFKETNRRKKTLLERRLFSRWHHNRQRHLG